MMKRITTFCLMLLTAFSASAQNKTVVAVLPYKVTVDGRIPKKLTETDLSRMKLEEGRFYQAGMISYLSRKNAMRKYRHKNIIILSAERVNQMLLDSGLTQGQIDSLPIETLSTKLGVDRVVTGSVNKTILMSDEASAGIYAAGVILGTPMYNATAQLNILCRLSDNKNGAQLWGKQYFRQTSFSWNDEQALKKIHRRSARKMMKKMLY